MLPTDKTPSRGWPRHGLPWRSDRFEGMAWGVFGQRKMIRWPKMVLPKGIAILLLSLGCVLSTACSVNPATGQSDFTLFMSAAEELRVGAREHPKILEQFGGAYDDPELVAYVDSLGQFLVQTAELPNLNFTFTILDSPIINAFALPGGYIYVTRGLMALANNEAELAAVLAHEIAHVTGRHSAQRYSQAVTARLGLDLLGAFGINPTLGDFLFYGSELYLRSYSRSQEYEADSLAVRYLSRAGFAPTAMASFLDQMQAYDALDGQGQAVPTFLSTHPQTADRVRKAIDDAQGSQVADPITARNIYLDKIDGLLYGADPDEGMIEGRRFLNTLLDFTFTLPQGFQARTIPNGIMASGPDDTKILFDTEKQPAPTDAMTYLRRDLSPHLDLRRIEAIDLNGFKAATGATSVNAHTLQVVVISLDPYRLGFLAFSAPRQHFAKWQETFRRTTYGFQQLDDSDKTAIGPRRLVVVTVQPGESIDSLARLMVFGDVKNKGQSADLKRNWFRVLNGFREDHVLRPGDTVKLVVRQRPRRSVPRPEDML